MTFYEKRKFKRVKGVLKTICLIGEAGNPVEFFADSENLSEGGIRIISDQELAPDTQLALVLWLPGHEEELSLSGKVIYTNRSEERNSFFETGIQFLFLSDKNKTAIQEYVTGNGS